MALYNGTTMSFFSDLGSFLNDAKQVNDEITSVKDDIIQSAKTTVTQISDQASDVKNELGSSVDAVVKTTKDAASDAASQLRNT